MQASDSLQRFAIVNLLRWPNAAQNDGYIPIPPSSSKRAITMTRSLTSIEVGAAPPVLSRPDPPSSLDTALLAPVNWPFGTTFADENSKRSDGLFLDAVRGPILFDLAKLQWYSYERRSPLAHLLYGFNTFVSRHVRLFDNAGDPVQAQLNRQNMLTIIDLSLRHGHSSETLATVQAQLNTLFDVAIQLGSGGQYNHTTLMNSMIGIADAEANRRPDAARFVRDYAPYARLLSAWFANQDAQAVTNAHAIADIDSRLCLMPVVYAYQCRQSVDALARTNTSGVPASALQVEKLAAQLTIVSLSTFYSQALQASFSDAHRPTAVFIQQVLAVLLMARTDLPWLLTGPVHEEPLLQRQVPSTPGVRRFHGATLNGNRVLRVGCDDHEALRNWTVQLACYPVAPSSGGVGVAAQEYRALMNGDSPLVDANLMECVREQSALDDMFYSLTRPVVMAISNRALNSHYASLQQTEFDFRYVCGSRADRLLWSGQDVSMRVLDEQTRARSIHVDRALRALVAAHWHRYYSLYPDADYLRQVTSQLAQLDKALGEEFTTQEIRKVLPEAMFDLHAVSVVTKPDAQGVGIPMAAAASGPAAILSAAAASIAGSFTGLFSSITQPRVVAAPPSATAPPPPFTTPPLSPLEPLVPGRANLDFVLGAPGQPNLSLVRGGQPEQMAFMTNVLMPLYAERPHLIDEGMAFALRWVIGIGLWQRATRRALVDQSLRAHTDQLRSPTEVGVTPGIDYRTHDSQPPRFTGTGVLATDADLAEGQRRGLRLQPERIAAPDGRQPAVRWALRVHFGSTQSVRILLDARDGKLDAPDTVDANQITELLVDYDTPEDASGAFQVLLMCAILPELDDSDLQRFVHNPSSLTWGRLQRIYSQSGSTAFTLSKNVSALGAQKAEIARLLLHVRNMIVAVALRSGGLLSALHELGDFLFAKQQDIVRTGRQQP